MNLAINAISALQGGGQSYIINTLKFAKEFPDIKIYVFSPPQLAHLYDNSGIKVIPCAFASKSILHRGIWAKTELPRALKSLKIDLVFCPGGVLHFKPPKGCLTAVTFQNMLIFDRNNWRRYPAGYRRFRLKLLEQISRRTFSETDLLIFISEFAKKVVDEKVPQRKGSSVLIPHGLAQDFRTSGRNDIKRLEIIPSGDYLLYVSVIDVFKAHLEVVRAYYLLTQRRQTPEKLLLVGPEYPAYANILRTEIKKLGLRDKVVLTGNIPYTDMPSVYYHAKAHIFASTCENCPNIVLESLGSGRPLFLSKISPMPELAGDAAVYFDPRKPEELADLLFQYLDDKQWSEEMARRTVRRSLLYSWESTARQTFQSFINLYKG